MKNRDIKILIIIELLFIALATICLFLIFKFQQDEYKKELNNILMSVIEIVDEKYPEFKDVIIKEIINVNDVNNTDNILKKYGINTDEILINLNLEEKTNRNLIFNILFVLLLFVILLTIFIIYELIKNKKLRKISYYLEELYNKNYSLLVSSNNEGEISLLKNNIYKVTVMLREENDILKKEKKALSDSISDISHQIKTPLTSISVMLDILSSEKNIDEDRKNKILHEVTKQIKWINWLLVSLLKLAKLDTKTVNYKFESINLNEFINDCVKKLEIIIEINNVNVVTKINENIEIYIDKDWMKEAVINIIKNAIEHSRENGEIDIECETNSVYTSIKIVDYGEGINKTDLENIFKKFYKGKNSNKDSIGVGLSLAKRIIEQQNGTITVKSEPNKGTTFEIKLYKHII